MAKAATGLGKGPGNTPDELDDYIKALRARAHLARALMGGTPAMVKAGEKYLPKMRNEDSETYEGRLKITVLRNYYRRTLSGLGGKLMRNGLKLDPAVDSAKFNGEWLRDIDCAGTSADVLFKRLFTWAVCDAVSWILPDYPMTGGTQSLADEREKGIRPWMIPLSIWDVCGLRTERVGGREEVAQLRYIMKTEEPVGMFGRETVETVRVVEPLVIRDYRRSGSKKEWAQHGTDIVNTLGRVALREIASDVDDSAHPRGGMEDMAELNKEHWQLRSDQRLALRINSFPILFGAGMESLPPIGPEAAVLAADPNATLQFVESTGAALTAGRQELIDLEDAMRAMSVQYQAKQVAQTATGSAIDAKEANAPAQGWAINAKRAFEAAMSDMAELAGGGKNAKGGAIMLDTDSLVSSMDAAALTELRAARASREISRETYIAGLKRADVLTDDYDADADKELIDDEEPLDLGGMNTPGGPKPKPGAKK